MKKKTKKEKPCMFAGKPCPECTPTTKKKDVVLTVTPREYKVILSALFIIESGYTVWNQEARQGKFIRDLLNKIAP